MKKIINGTSSFSVREGISSIFEAIGLSTEKILTIDGSLSEMEYNGEGDANHQFMNSEQAIKHKHNILL